MDMLEGSEAPQSLEALNLLFWRHQKLGAVRDESLERQLVQTILEHAKRVVAHPSRPTQMVIEPFSMNGGEIALDEMLEESPIVSEPNDLLIQRVEEKPYSCVAMLDTSSSMAGDKHLLASVAVAVLLLEVASRDLSVVTFASDAKVVKRMSSEELKEATLLKFLRHKPKGFTNIADGLTSGIRQVSSGKRRRVGLIATDGRSTEGGDPLDKARQFDFLVVLHLHGSGSHLDASKELAQAGHGVCLEVETFEELPRRIYDATRLLARV